MLSQVLEHHGIATVALSSMREVTEQLRPPRSLYCDFPLGRPLGKPFDAAFQHRVLAAAFALLGQPEGPVIADFPESVVQDLEEPVVCVIPPRETAGEHPAVAEARALLAAYGRSVRRRGATNVGRLVDAEGIPEVVGAFVRLAAGAPVDQSGIRPEDLMAAASDVRAYYEEAALALADHVPAAGQAAVWLYRYTLAGAALADAHHALRNAGLPRLQWVYAVPRAFWKAEC